MTWNGTLLFSGYFLEYAVDFSEHDVDFSEHDVEKRYFLKQDEQKQNGWIVS